MIGTVIALTQVLLVLVLYGLFSVCVLTYVFKYPPIVLPTTPNIFVVQPGWEGFQREWRQEEEWGEWGRGDEFPGGERRVSRGSGGSGEALSEQHQQHKKVLFSEPATVKDSKTHSQSPTGPLLEQHPSQDEVDSPKSQKKSAISTWRAACGMTKDKTKDLLKRWRTLPDTGPEGPKERPPLQEIKANTTGDHNWSVHVWGGAFSRMPGRKSWGVPSVRCSSASEAGKSVFDKHVGKQDEQRFRRVDFVPNMNSTWVKRCPSDDETCDLDKEKVKKCDKLTSTQKEKLTYFFAHVFDMDRDDIIAMQDFEGFTEGGKALCSGRANFALKSLNDLVKESYGMQDTLNDVQGHCQDADDSSIHSASAFLAWLDNPKPDRIGRILQEEFKLSEWSSNCGEYLILQQVQQGLAETFIYPLKQDADSFEGETQVPKELDRLFLGLEDWLVMWGDILENKKDFYQLPLWLQFLPKVIFAAINKSGTGQITKEELGSFYSSVMGYPAQKLNELLNDAYTAMTAGGDFKLTYDCYRLCFANFLFGRHPNGPGQYIFGAAQRAPPTLFPIDYSAMNSSQEDIELYDGSLKSNRSSIIV